jgi:hypothetical protein
VSDEAVVLTPDEVRSLAWHIAGQKLADAADWLSWEDVPLLDEETYQALVGLLVERCGPMCHVLSVNAGAGAAILERVQ